MRYWRRPKFPKPSRPLEPARQTALIHYGLSLPGWAVIALKCTLLQEVLLCNKLVHYFSELEYTFTALLHLFTELVKHSCAIVHPCTPLLHPYKGLLHLFTALVHNCTAPVPSASLYCSCSALHCTPCTGASLQGVQERNWCEQSTWEHCSIV